MESFLEYPDSPEGSQVKAVETSASEDAIDTCFLSKPESVNLNFEQNLKDNCLFNVRLNYFNTRTLLTKQTGHHQASRMKISVGG